MSVGSDDREPAAGHLRRDRSAQTLADHYGRLEQDPHQDTRELSVPDHHNRGVELLMRGVQQGGVVGFGEAAPFALAAAVGSETVDQPRPMPGPDTHQPGDRYPSRTFARHRDLRCPAPPAPGTGLRRAQRLPGLVLETQPGTLLRRYRFPAGHASRRHVAIAASSRSIARCAGTCGENPSRCNRYDTPRNV